MGAGEGGLSPPSPLTLTTDYLPTQRSWLVLGFSYSLRYIETSPIMRTDRCAVGAKSRAALRRMTWST